MVHLAAYLLFSRILTVKVRTMPAKRRKCGWGILANLYFRYFQLWSVVSWSHRDLKRLPSMRWRSQLVLCVIKQRQCMEVSTRMDKPPSVACLLLCSRIGDDERLTDVNRLECMCTRANKHSAPFYWHIFRNSSINPFEFPVVLLIGSCAIPGAVIGILVGGYSLRRFQLTRKGKNVANWLPRNVICPVAWWAWDVSCAEAVMIARLTG